MSTITEDAGGVKPSQLNPANTDTLANVTFYKAPARRYSHFDPTTFGPAIDLIGKLKAHDHRVTRESKTLSCRGFPRYLKFALKACRQEANDQQKEEVTWAAKEESQHDAVAICIESTVGDFFKREECKQLASARVELTRLMREMENVELAEMMQAFVDKFCFAPPTTSSGAEQLKARIPEEAYMSLAGAKAKLGVPIQTLAIVAVAMAVEDQDAPNRKHVELAQETVRRFFKTVGDYRCFIEAFVTSQKARGPAHLHAVH